MTDLKELIERCEKATGPDTWLDALLECEFPPGIGTGHRVSRSNPAKVTADYQPADGGPWSRGTYWPPSYTASIDAALGLVERVLPGPRAVHMTEQLPPSGEVNRRTTVTHMIGMPVRGVSASAPTFPLAILLALLRALQSKQEPSP